MIDIRFTITEAEYLEAQKIFSHDQMRRSRYWFWPLAIVFALSFVVTILATPRPISLGTIPPYTSFFLVMATMPLWLPLVQIRGFKKRFEKEKINLTNAHLRLDETGYFCEVPGIGTGVAEWNGISVWHEGRYVFILRSGFLMRIVPQIVSDSRSG